MRRYRARVGVGRYIYAIVLCSIVLALCSCINDSGTAEPSATAAAAPLSDSAICGILSNDNLRSELGFETFYYSYTSSSGPGVNGPDEEGGRSYVCHMRSDRNPFGDMSITYGVSDELHFSGTADGSPIKFDEIPVTYPDAAIPATFEGRSGEGWAWTDGVSTFVAWRYPDGYVLGAQLTSWTADGPTSEQVDDFHSMLEGVIDTIPGVAAGPPQAVRRSASSSHDDTGSEPTP